MEKHAVRLLQETMRSGSPTTLDSAVNLLERALANTPADHPGRSRYSYNLGFALRLRYDRTGNLSDLDAAVTAYRMALDAGPSSPRERADCLINLSDALLVRSEATGDPADLDAVIAAYRTLVEEAPAHGGDLAGHLCDLATALGTRFRMSGDGADLAAAAAAGQASVHATSPGHPERVRCVSNHGTILLEQFKHEGADTVLDAAVAAHEAALAAARPDDPQRPRLSANVAVAQMIRYQLHGRAPYLADALSAAQLAVNTTHARHPDRAGYLMTLSGTLAALYDRNGDEVDLADAVTAAHEAVDGTPPGHEDRADCLAGLGSVLLREFERTGDPATFDAALAAAREAVESTPSGHSDRAARVHLLDMVKRARSDRPAGLADVPASEDVPTNAPADLDATIAAARSAVAVAPSADPTRPGLLSDLGSALMERFERTRSAPDITASIDAAQAAVDTAGAGELNYALYLTRLSSALRQRSTLTGSAVEVGRAAVAAVPSGHPHHAMCLSNLTAALASRTERTGNPDDIEDAVATGRAAVENTTPDDPGWATSQSNLGGVLLNRFLRTGDLADLDAAVAANRTALEATPTGHPHHVSRLSNHCDALTIRFGRTGSIADIDAAISAGRAAVEAAALDHPDRIVSLTNLGNALTRRYERTGNRADLDAAVTACQAASDAPADGDPDRSRYLSNLGVVLSCRFALSGDAADLNAGIAAYRAAVKATLDGDPQLAATLSNLGLALATRFECTGRPADLQASVNAGHAALAATPADHPGRSVLLANLGSAMVRKYELTAWPGDLKAVVQLHRQAATTPAAPPRTRTSAARTWGQAAAAGNRWRDAAAGFEVAVEQLSRVAPRRLVRSDQEHLLDELGGLGPDAAACCIHAGQPGRALELLDQSRGVLLGQALDTRVDLGPLAELYPDLARRLATLRDELDGPGSAAMSSPSRKGAARFEAGGIAGARDAAEHRVGIAEAFDRMIAEIRDLPGFGSFLRTPSISDLAGAATAGPVVVINVSQYGSHALILTARGLKRPLPLPGLTPGEVQERAAQFLAAVDGPLHSGAERAISATLWWLWDAIAGPVLRRLGIKGPPAAGRPWPRLWWCPVGPLSLLPIHAAGHHDARGASVIDRVVSSYTPTLRALARADRTGPAAEPGNAALRGDERLLAVAMPRTPGVPDLPGADGEIAVLSRWFGDRLTVLAGPQATHEAVRSALPRVRWAHFACHGTADPDDPSAGRLLLADHQQRPFTVTDVARLRMDGAEAAFLSACSTARPGRRLTDEAIHLASAFQLAGYRHVIGTLWSVNDTAALAIADDIYTSVATGTRDIAGAVHAATRMIRDACPDAPSLWASHIHVGGSTALGGFRSG